MRPPTETESPFSPQTLYELNLTYSYAEIAEMLGITRNVVAGRIHRYLVQKGSVKDTPNLFLNPLKAPLTLQGDWLITGDVHVPATDYDFAQLVGVVGKKHMKKGNRNLLIAGDLFNADAFSRYINVVAPPAWAQERDAARLLVSQWLTVFDKVVFIMGNHDRRIQMITAGAFDETDIFGMITSSPKAVSSVYGWCTIETPTGTWRVTHPKNYGINQLSVAEALAQKHQCHVITHHEHHAAIGHDRYKRWVLVNNGALVDDKKLAYVQLDDSKSAGMAKAFTLLKDGHPHLLADSPMTDWTRWV